ALWPFLAVSVTYLIYQAISLPVNFTGRDFDLAAHRARVAAWYPQAYPSVDIYLPICGEPIELLRHTWDAVFELVAAYPGAARACGLGGGALRGGALGGDSAGLRLSPPPRSARLKEERHPAVPLPPPRRQIPGHLRRGLRAAPRLPPRAPPLQGRPGDRH